MDNVRKLNNAELVAMKDLEEEALRNVSEWFLMRYVEMIDDVQENDSDMLDIAKSVAPKLDYSDEMFFLVVSRMLNIDPKTKEEHNFYRCIFDDLLNRMMFSRKEYNDVFYFLFQSLIRKKKEI